jgi:hypothetical protein
VKQASLRVRQEEDFYAWCFDQARILRELASKLSSLDCVGIAEELEGMARNEAHALTSDLEVLLTHLLKWHYEPNRRNRGWRLSALNARSEIRDALDDSPSLRSKLPVLLKRAYERARRSAGVEMEMDEQPWEQKAPASCPWDFDTVMGDFWPEPPDGRDNSGEN